MKGEIVAGHKMHKESEYSPDEAVDRVLELLREINEKNKKNEKESGKCQTKIEVLSS